MNLFPILLVLLSSTFRADAGNCAVLQESRSVERNELVIQCPAPTLITVTDDGDGAAATFTIEPGHTYRVVR